MNRRSALVTALLTPLGCAIPCDDDGLRQACPNGFDAAAVDASTTMPASSDGASSSSGAPEPASSSDDGEPASSSDDGESSTAPVELESSSEDATTEPASSDESSSSSAVSEESGLACEPAADGVYGRCSDANGNPDLGACESPALDCIADEPELPSVVVCYGPCDDPCDCPAAPAGHEDQVVCEDLTGDDSGECFISCIEDDCPDDMVCFQGFICMHPV